MSDKLIKRSTEILPVDDFAKRVEEELRKRGEEPAPRIENRECPYAFKFEENSISRCKLKRGHEGEHGNAMLSWRSRCPSVEPRDGCDQCRYQDGHPGAHMDVDEKLTWTDESKPAVIGDAGNDAFDILGEVLRSTPFQQALANKLKQRVPIMQRVPLQKARQYSVGFGPERLAAGAMIQLNWESDILFRGERVFFSGDSDGVYLDNVFVGTRAQLPNVGGIPATLLVPEALSGNIPQMDTVQPGTRITLIVRNATSEMRRVAFTVFGKAVV